MTSKRSAASPNGGSTNSTQMRTRSSRRRMARQMPERTVRSPGGDDVLVLPDAEFAQLIGVDIVPGSNVFGQVMRTTPPRIALLAALWQRGQARDRREGRATAILTDRARLLDREAGLENPTAV